MMSHAVQVWMDDYKQVFYDSRHLAPGSIKFGDLADRLAFKARSRHAMRDRH